MKKEVIQNQLFDISNNKKYTLVKRDSNNTSNECTTKYATCLVNIKGMGLKTFSYLVPHDIQDKIQIGHALLVPFGNKRVLHAFCVGFTDTIPTNIHAKYILKLLDSKPLFSKEYLNLLNWVAKYYCTDLITVLNAALPLNLLEKSLKTEYLIEFITDNGATKRQLEILKKLKISGKISLIKFEKEVKTTRATIKKLEEKGLIKLSIAEIYRNPLNVLNITKKEDLFELTDLQNKVYNSISEKINIETSPEILLHGITASGKTEVYFKLIDDTLKIGKNVLFLVPEIALASQLTKRLAKKFGTDDVAIWHSSISEGERYDVWQKLYDNKVKILAGARSAVFAPLKNIGLIIIDEEHESAYKQTFPAPRYNAKTVAKKLSELHNCPLLLGSATPDISSYYEAVANDSLFEMLVRYNNAKVPPVTIINMQEYNRAAYKGLISKPLQVKMQEVLDKKQQVILLINRRGFSTSTQCQGCGQIIQCPNCAIPLIWHAKDNMLKCHYCNHVQYFPDRCPNCGSEALKMTGTGTQKIEQYIKELYPNYNIARIDSDVLTKKTEHIKILEAFQNKEIDILVGTQMIAKGLDNKNVTLVGVLSADASFNLPDFRASERGFQLLTQVAGRAGRGEFDGKVIFQTYNPDYYALETAKQQNYRKFYDKEIISRQEFDYPPFTQVFRIIVQAQRSNRAEKAINEIATELCNTLLKVGQENNIEILGPTPCIIERINSYYRYQIIIKNKLGSKGHLFISKFINKVIPPKDIRLTIDVDPLDIL